MKTIIIGSILAILMSPILLAGIIWYFVVLYFGAGIEIGELIFESLDNWLERESEEAERAKDTG